MIYYGCQAQFPHPQPHISGQLWHSCQQCLVVFRKSCCKYRSGSTGHCTLVQAQFNNFPAPHCWPIVTPLQAAPGCVVKQLLQIQGRQYRSFSMVRQCRSLYSCTVTGQAVQAHCPAALGRTFSVWFLRIAAWCRPGKGDSAAAGRLHTTRAAQGS